MALEPPLIDTYLRGLYPDFSSFAMSLIPRRILTFHNSLPTAQGITIPRGNHTFLPSNTSHVAKSSNLSRGLYPYHCLSIVSSDNPRACNQSTAGLPPEPCRKSRHSFTKSMADPFHLSDGGTSR